MSNYVYIPNGRDYSIDFLKFLAALLITWSHFEKPLGDFAMLATGGSFGDSLFFFASGYTLLLSKRNVTFANWYKRRISRIYPTVFAWSLLSTILWGGTDNMLDIILHGGGFFVTCIMLFYILFYPIKLFLNHYLLETMLFCFISFGSVYFVLDFSDLQLVYYWKWSFFFISMLLGALMGKRRSESKPVLKKNNSFLSFVGLIISIILYYLFLMVEKSCPFITIFTIFPLLGFTFFLYKLCNTNIARKIYETKTMHTTIMIIGGLCLEIYIVQPVLLTDKMNNLFPLNLLLMFTSIITVAYILRCSSRLWVQTFKDADYNWKEIAKLY